MGSATVEVDRARRAGGLLGGRRARDGARVDQPPFDVVDDHHARVEFECCDGDIDDHPAIFDGRDGGIDDDRGVGGRRRCERRPGAYFVDVEYPALEIDTNPGAAAQMNDLMTARLDRQVLDLQSFMTTNRAAPATVEGHLLTVTLEVHSFFAEVISLHTSLGWYGGGAVTDLIHVTFAFDPRTGDEVPFAALFAPSPGRGAKIEDVVESELRRSGVAVWSGGTRMDALLEDSLDFDVPDNYAAYALTRSGIVVYFRRYQVGPGSTGSPAAMIPYATWADLIASDSLAAHAMFS